MGFFDFVKTEQAEGTPERVEPKIEPQTPVPVVEPVPTPSIPEVVEKPVPVVEPVTLKERTNMLRIFVAVPADATVSSADTLAMSRATEDFTKAIYGASGHKVEIESYAVYLTTTATGHAALLGRAASVFAAAQSCDGMVFGLGWNRDPVLCILHSLAKQDGMKVITIESEE